MDITNEASESTQLNDSLSEMSQSSQQTGDKNESFSPTSGKIKASPLYKTNAKQKYQTARKSKSIPLTAESFIESFSNPSLISAIAPAIQKMIVPSVKDAITAALADVRTDFLKELTERNAKLQDTISKQTDLINSQQTQIDNQLKLINDKHEKIDILEKKVDDLTIINIELKTSLNDLEQYGRRNSLRFNNIKMDQKLEEREMKNEMVKFINANILLTDQPKITEADIDRCHPVGQKAGSKPKQILIKFSSYHTKWNVFRCKGNLKDCSENVFVCEDLTVANYRLVKSLNELKKNKRIYSFWTTNGNIRAKVYEDGPTISVKPYEDIGAKLGLFGYM